MRILLLINSLGAGGAERSTLEWAKYLKSQDETVSIVCLKHKEYGLEEEAEQAGIPLIFLKPGSLRNRYLQFTKLIKEYKPEVVHSVLFEANILLRAVKFFNPALKTIESLVNTPYTKERRADSKLPKIKFAIVKLYDLLTARFTRSHYHTITQKVYEHYKPIYGIGSGGYSVIYRGRKPNRKTLERESLRTEMGFGDSTVLINVGRQEFQKGQIVLLKALVQLKNSGTDISHLKVVILGREGAYTSGMMEYLKENHLEQYVTLAGFRNDVDRYLAAADVFVFPSYFEGLGGALIEGLAAHLPVICSDLPVLREVMGDDQSALFFKTGNEHELARCISKLASDTEFRKRLAEASFRRYSACFDLEVIHLSMFRMYKKIVHGDKAA